MGQSYERSPHSPCPPLTSISLPILTPICFPSLHGKPSTNMPFISRRQPELTPCYKIVQTEFETFRQERELEGRPLPQYITDEFEAYLKCGILAHAFLRLLCPDCNHEKITAFSCKKRGFVGANVLALGKKREPFGSPFFKGMASAYAAASGHPASWAITSLAFKGLPLA